MGMDDQRAAHGGRFAVAAASATFVLIEQPMIRLGHRLADAAARLGETPATQVP
jgi:hypothetical protein